MRISYQRDSLPLKLVLLLKGSLEGFQEVIVLLERARRAELHLVVFLVVVPLPPKFVQEIQRAEERVADALVGTRFSGGFRANAFEFSPASERSSMKLV